MFIKLKPSRILKSLWDLALKKKLLSVIILAVLAVVVYFIVGALSQNSGQTQYATAAVEKGTLIVSVSGSGQVLASEEIDVKPEVSGNLSFVGIKNGEAIKAGRLMFKIDEKDASRAKEEAAVALETARLELEDLEEPPDELELLQAENGLRKAKQAKEDAEDAIASGYEDAFGSVTDVFFDLPGIMEELEAILYSEEISQAENIYPRTWNKSYFLNSVLGNNASEKTELETLIELAEKDYGVAREKYEANFLNYRDTSRYSESAVIEELLNETLNALRAEAELMKREVNMIDFWTDYRSSKNLKTPAAVTSYQTELKSYTSKVNGFINDLLAVRQSFKDNRSAALDAEYAAREKELALEDLKNGPDEIDIKTKELQVRQKEDAFASAQESLKNCSIYAPFDGVVAKMNISSGDAVSPSVSLATFITNQKVVDLSLNEVDATAVKAGQKAMILFDAIEGLTISGEVAEIDALGEVSQGVVTYAVKVIFDVEDERIKPGMSASVTIVTDAKQDVLMVANSAIKSENNSQYVEILENNAVSRRAIEAGISNDESTEVVSGLAEGDLVITQTISAGGQTNVSQSRNSGFGMPGMGGAVIREFR